MRISPRAPLLLNGWNNRYAASNAARSVSGDKSHDIAKLKGRLATFGAGGEVTLDRHPTLEHIATITLNHPAKKNGLSGRMMVQLHDAVEQLSTRADYKAVLLRGSVSGNVFCSGADLELVRNLAKEELHVMHEVMCSSLRGLSSLRAPVIAAIDGACLGGGSELASSCDVRFAAPDAKVGFVQARMGLSPGWGGAPFIRRALGRARAIHFLASAKILAAPELLEIGYLQAVYSSEEELIKLLEKYNNLEHDVIISAKAAIAAYDGHLTLPEARASESATFRALWGGPIQKRALAKNIKHK